MTYFPKDGFQTAADADATGKGGVSRLVKAWESKNAGRSKRAAGLGLMAVSLAACGGESDEEITSLQRALEEALAGQAALQQQIADLLANDLGQGLPQVVLALTTETYAIAPNGSEGKRTTSGDDIIIGRENDRTDGNKVTFDTWNLGDFVDGGLGYDTLVIALAGDDTDLDLAEGAGIVNVEALTVIIGSNEDVDSIELAHIAFDVVTVSGNKENDIDGTFQINDIDGQTDLILEKLRLSEDIVRNDSNEYDRTVGTVSVSDTVRNSDIGDDQGGADITLNHAFDNATVVNHTLNLSNLKSLFKNVESVLDNNNSDPNDPNLQDLYSLDVDINHDLNQDGVILNETINVSDVEADFIGGNHKIDIDIDNFAKVDEDGDSASGRESDGETVFKLVANVTDSEGIGLESRFDVGASSNADTAVLNLNGLVDPDATDLDLNQEADQSGPADDNSVAVVWSIEGIETTTFNIGAKGAEIDGFEGTAHGWSTGTGNEAENNSLFDNDQGGDSQVQADQNSGDEDDGNPRVEAVNDQTVRINAAGLFEVNEAFDLNGGVQQGGTTYTTRPMTLASDAKDITLTITGAGDVDLAAIETEFPSFNHEGWSEGVRAGDGWTGDHADDAVVLNATQHTGDLYAKISDSYFDVVNLGSGNDIIFNEGATGFLTEDKINTAVDGNSGSDLYVVRSTDLFDTVDVGAEELFGDELGSIQGVENLGLYLDGRAIDVSDWVTNNDVYLYEQRSDYADANVTRLSIQDDADVFVRGMIWNVIGDNNNDDDTVVEVPQAGYRSTDFDTPVHRLDVEGHEGGSDDNIRIHMQENARFTGNADFNSSMFATQIEGVEEVLVASTGENEGPDETADSNFETNVAHYLKLFDVTDLGTVSDEENWALEDVIVIGDKDIVLELDILEVSNGVTFDQAAGSDSDLSVAEFTASLRTINIDTTGLTGNGSLVFNAGASGTDDEELTFLGDEEAAFGFGIDLPRIHLFYFLQVRR